MNSESVPSETHERESARRKKRRKRRGGEEEEWPGVETAGTGGVKKLLRRLRDV